MIKLKMKTEAYWLELGSGVKVKVKPCTSAVFYEAKAYMNGKVSDIANQYKNTKESGVIDETLPNLEDIKKREAFADQHLVIGLALAGIIDWDGVLEADTDEKAPLTTEKITELFSNFWVLAESFRHKYSGIQEMIEAEKNAFTPEPNGTLETGEVIAKDVGKKKPSAPLESADTSTPA